MNNSQVSYARNRINEAFSAKQSELYKKHFPPKPKKKKTVLSHFQWMLQCLEKGDFKVRKYNKSRYIYSYESSDYLLDYIDFPTQPGTEPVPAVKVNENRQYVKELKALKEARNKVLDELILGDVKEALKLVQEFVNYKV
jgi:predicted S18 family serine protease